ncbi:Uncharacterized protein conserved in bacteria [Brevibacterium casei]|uniref:Uncharacterized protein conserved in bacteria n=1 Tax=Brevibacterium casei TaxID=33889 RepID=A0A449CZ72_9MICO|nr:hypothetical protein [Brevibacterium casei]VEW10578.1 Uncharacterized protein conserved in bacteria [Brevibacterium casei]
MKYALLLMGNVTDADCGEDGGPDPAEFMAFDKEITDAGIVVGGFALDGPEHGVRVSDSVVTSGPFAESGEFVGGSYVIGGPDDRRRDRLGEAEPRIARRAHRDRGRSPTTDGHRGTDAALVLPPSGARTTGGCSPLSRQVHDLDLAEEALADAMVRAVESWPARGVPQRHRRG